MAGVLINQSPKSLYVAAESELAADAATITVTGISTSLRQLIVYVYGSVDNVAGNMTMDFNNDTASSAYSFENLTGDGAAASAASSVAANTIIIAAGGTMAFNEFSIHADIFQPSLSLASDEMKLFQVSFADGGDRTSRVTGSWDSSAGGGATDRITSIRLRKASNNFSAGTRILVLGLR